MFKIPLLVNLFISLIDSFIYFIYFFIHQKQSRFLAIEVYKLLKNINPEFMWEFFNKNPVQYNLRKRNIVYLPPARSSSYGINSLAFRRSLLWNSLPRNVKQSHNLGEFKLKLRNLGNIHYTCVVCRWN